MDWLKWLALCCFFSTVEVQAENFDSEYGILKCRLVETGEEKKFCLISYPPFELPNSEGGENYFGLCSDCFYDLCTEIPPQNQVANRVVFATLDTSCSLIEQSTRVKDSGGIGTLFVGKDYPSVVNASNQTTAFGIISNSTYSDIQLMSENGSVEVASHFSEDGPVVKYNLIIIWILAEGSVVAGAFWSGIIRHRLYVQEQSETRSVYGTGLVGEGSESFLREKSFLAMSPKVIFLMVLIMCVMLVLLWFLMEYVVYIIIALFCIASFISIYSCLEPLIMKLGFCRCRTFRFNLVFLQGVLEVRQIILLLFAVALPLIWVFLRKEPYAWVLQDILGIAFCINIMKTVRLPNLMICTLLLSLLVVYDIFFVFVTPFITSSGTSIMVDVAQGGGTDEELPMVLKVPLFLYPEYYDVCGIRNYSILGFGDILVPGLLISYVHSFDLTVGTPYRLYFLVNCIAYGVGLVITFIVLYISRGAQPALFYLVPCTLIPTVVIAAARGELSALWKDRTVRQSNSEADDQSQGRIAEGAASSPLNGAGIASNSLGEPAVDTFGDAGPMHRDILVAKPDNASLGDVSSTGALDRSDDSD